MKLKTKLSAFILMFAAVVCILVVGVWAVKSTNFQVGGDITFKATGINATISAGTLSSTGTLTNTDASEKMKEIKITTAKTSSQIEEEFKSWEGLALEFNEAGDDVTISFTITNDGTGESDYVYINVGLSSEASSNATASINTSNVLLNPNGQENDSHEFVITFSVTEKTLDASITGFVVNFEMLHVEGTVYDADTGTDYTFDFNATVLAADITQYLGEATEVTIPSYVKKAGVLYRLRAIKEMSFKSSDITSITIPDSVNIMSEAFIECTTLKSIRIPAANKSLGDFVFYGCSSLESVIIPASVISIGEMCFDGCTSLANVYYEGSEEDWAAIYISDGNSPLTSANITYNYVAS